VRGSRLTNKDVIDESLWNRLVMRITRDRGVDESHAERVMDQTLGFLKLCAVEPDVHYGPSEVVDLGWHTFILDTREYARFCNRLAGRFIHHVPTDGMDVSDVSRPDTVAAMVRYGIEVDDELWPDLAEDCYGDQCRGSGDGRIEAA
jgi:hypothetical protein